VLPADGVMMLHTITSSQPTRSSPPPLPLTMKLLKFSKFIMDEIFPGGICRSRRPSRSTPPRPVSTQARPALRLHYARTLDIWAAALEARKDEASRCNRKRGLRPLHEVPDRLRRSVRDGYTDVCQFTLVKS